MPSDVRSSPDPITRKIAAWCDALMDLSRRNPLLSLPKSAIPLFDAPDTLWEMPRDGGKRIRLVSEKLPGTDILRGGLKPNDRALPMDRYRTLKTMFQTSRRSIEEQGVPILFVAAGILEWREPGRSDPLRSPLLLLPVDLERLPLDAGYFLSPRDDEARLNPTLAYRLGQPDIQITLPEFGDVKPGEYLTALIEQLPSKLGATIDANAAFLGRFSYLNLTMYEELSARIDEARAHPLIASIAGDTTAIAQLPRPKVPELDTELPSKVFHVLSADPSQEAAITAAREGANLVIQGPPGTGKTQTIANLIASCIADGKRVLFVSEKMAALDAVYRRLTACGLADLCLEAHSHKAGKAELLTQLRKAKAVAEGNAKPYRAVDTSALVALRDDFNRGVAALHVPREPLGISIYEARSLVAALADVPDIFFALPTVESVDADHLYQLETIVERFAGFHDLFPAIPTHPWRGLHAETFTPDLPKQIEMVLTPWHQVTVSLLENTAALGTRLGLPDADVPTHTAGDVDGFISLAKQVLQTPHSLPEWLSDSDKDLPLLRRSALATAARYQIFQEQRTALLSQFTPAILEQDHTALIAALHTTPRAALASAFGDSWADVSDETFTAAVSEMEQSEVAITRLMPGLERLSKIVGVAVPASLAEIEALLTALAPCRTDFKPRPNWFTTSVVTLIKTVQETQIRFAERDAARETVAERFDKGVYQLDVHALHTRFQNEYDNLLRYFKGGYWSDNKTLSAVLKPGATLKGADIPALLRAATVAKDTDSRLTAEDESLRSAFPGYYVGVDTAWETLLVSLRQTALLRTSYPGGVPDTLRERMCASGAPWEELRDQIELVQEQFGKVQDRLKALETSIALPVDVGLPKNRFPLVELRERLSALRPVIATFLTNRRNVRTLAKENISTHALVQGLENARASVAEQAAIIADFPQQQQQFVALFAGWHTDWETIRNALDNAIALRTLCTTRYAIVPDAVVSLATDGTRVADREAIAGLVRDLESNRLSLDNAWHELPTIFDFATLAASGTGMSPNDSFLAQRDWALSRLRALPEIERYLKFVAVRDECDRFGLLSFCERMIQERPTFGQIPRIFRKAFYSRWNDSVTAATPEVQPLIASEHGPRRERYVALDIAHLRDTPGRIRERVAERRNLIFGTEFNVGEMATLNRYLAQTRPRASVRKILGDIPNLLFKLTPCLMMSPLSVSLFLAPDRITFDIVIFDEASQVFPEYALGALLRAEQAVIAGDSKQLPPTPFFKKTQDVDSYEDDEDADPREFESVLDAAKAAFGQTTLNWHYRSRHESLIDFSNREIYTPENQALNTFPSSRTPSALRFVHVASGVYQGGTGAKRDNPVEAVAVAQLVAEQVRQSTRQSVGVITMSGAQEECIRAAIEELKRQDSFLATTLNEDADDTEPFFIKSIEDVQGDERDIIFLSVGYGKWADGKARMIFGPISRTGGERRLNVAITRAKEKLTVVSSLLPSEITVTEDTKRGVHLLRQFLARAQAATGAARAGSDTTDDGFVEAVAEALSKRGHRVRRAVGTSEYRVDLAVEDPTDPERFILGIECDSENYRNARTTRAREHLRSEVLAGLGWRLLRIWSADWLRDPTMVLATIETAMQEPVPTVTPTAKATTPIVEEVSLPDEPSDINVSTNYSDTVASPAPRKQPLPGLTYFVPYTALLTGGEVTLYGNTRGDSLTRAEYVLEVIRQEGPVHRDVIPIRLRQGAGLNRIGAQIKRVAEDALSVLDQAKTIDRYGDFLRIAGATEVTARVPKPGDTPRPIEQVSIEEIAEVALVVIRQAGGVRNDEAVSETARQLGFERTGTMVRDRVQEAISRLEYENRVHVQGGQIRSLE